LLLALALVGCAPAAPRRGIEELGKIDSSVDWRRAFSRSIEIEAPIEELWAYLSDSGLATEWSSYFDHIRPLAGTAPDGTPGSVRRCFRNRDERGPQWDEMTALVEPRKRRLIHSFNFFGYRPSFWTRSSETLVEQRYEGLAPARSRLTFSTIAVPSSPWISRVLLALSEPETVRYFEINLRNIKTALESRRAGKPYVRPHAWEPAPASIGESWFTDPTATRNPAD
jgi:hypothetical protein